MGFRRGRVAVARDIAAQRCRSGGSDLRRSSRRAPVSCLLYLSLVWCGLFGVSSVSVVPIVPPWREIALVAGPLAAVVAGATRRFLDVGRA